MIETIRKIGIYVLLWVMTVAAAFQAGIIYEMKGLDSAKRRIEYLESEQKKMAGEIESHKAIFRGIAKGRMPQIP